MRRLLLTSAGIRNETLRSALVGLLDRPFADANVAVIPTASVAISGDHGWFVEDLRRVQALGWRELDVVELNGLPRATVLDRLGDADVIYAAGGNHFHLAHSIVANDLAAELAVLLESRVYVGMSAGSMQFSRPLSRLTGVAFGEEEQLRDLAEVEPESRSAGSTGTSSRTWAPPTSRSGPTHGSRRSPRSSTSRSTPSTTSRPSGSR